MCRLLGVTNFEYGRHERIVKNFCELARTGMVMAGDPPGHGDGWGLAFYRDGELALHKSGGNLLDEADRVIGMLREAATSPVMILHLRKSAWSDTTTTRHAHPFSYGNVAFVHNGVVYGYRDLLPGIDIPGLAQDALDTEVFFYRILSELPPDMRERAGETGLGSCGLGQAFRRTVSLIKRDYKFSSLNCLFSDGARLFAYRDFSKEPDYYSLYKTGSGISTIISSEPLDDRLQWEMMDKEEFLKIEVDPPLPL